MKIIRILNKVLEFINRHWEPKKKHSKNELDEELRRFKEHTGGERNGHQ